ncbi:MAG TPA: 3-oxoacyl-[acyl-carrier-protein] reductase [Anaerolineales bacterium]|nr:3-oxoacyl-[acyl-carrier-protein] reductase [Anaerolineales bacterium]
MRLQGKVAVVTGASRGIGRSIALQLGAEGAKVMVNFHSSRDAADQVVEAIRASGTEAVAYQADVSQYPLAEAMIKSAVQQYGDLHILINNAGITADGLIMTMSESDWDRVIDTNLKSTFNCSRAAVRHMLRRRYGRIINITSVAGQIGNAGQTNYSASKAGQIGFTKALAREVASRSITVNAVAAGYIETEIWAAVPEEARQALLRMVPLGRKGQPEEIANAVTFLASDDAAYITGHILAVDGGMAMF